MIHVVFPYKEVKREFTNSDSNVMTIFIIPKNNPRHSQLDWESIFTDGYRFPFA